ncbi:MAG: hypothetical protein ACXW1B_03095 [Nitrososphaeraceae archaeon]
MKTITHYSGTKQAKYIKGVQDTYCYLNNQDNPNNWIIVINTIRDIYLAKDSLKETIKLSYLILGLCGIAGLPAKAVIRYALRTKSSYKYLNSSILSGLDQCIN